VAIKKSELYSSLWKSCDELRGGMDASQYKDYVLVLLFVKYVSDKASSQSNYLLDVPEGASFADMVALRGDKDIGEKINKIIHRLAEANDLTGVINVADFNDPEKLGRGKEMVDRLSNLIGIFNSPALDFRGNRAEGDDLLGDAYEYLMRHFATESGKSKGQFYTPAEVSRILAKVVGMGSARSAGQTVYDPTCGSGSLLLKAHDEALSTTGHDLAIYGQEMDVATAALARMNMILHDAPTAEITPGGYSTLANPQFRNRDESLKTFDFVVANPPFSNKAWRNGFDPAHDEFGRFSAPYVLPPAKNGDFAFLLHIVASLKSTGKGAVILPHGVLFRGNAEAIIRREIIRRGYVKGIIGLPANLFYGTGIPACIVVLDKEEAATRTGIFMIDASKSFRKDGPKNRLREQDIHRIVDVFTRQVEADKYSRLVPVAEVEANGYNLNLARYVDSSVATDLQNIDGHLHGGIPQLDVDGLGDYWQVFPGLLDKLFSPARRGFSEMVVPAPSVADTITEHPEVRDFVGASRALFENWRTGAQDRLRAFDAADSPKALVELLSESILDMFRRAPLIDTYRIYQRFMDYWSASMQDDAYLISGGSWADAATPRLITDKQKNAGDFGLGKNRFQSDLLPRDVMVGRFFEAEATSIASLEAELATAEQELIDLGDEYGADGAVLDGVVDDRGKVTKKAVSARLKELDADPDGADAEDRRVLQECTRLLENVSTLKAQLKRAREELDVALAARFRDLTVDEIKQIAIANKWMARLGRAVDEEVQRVAAQLTGRIEELASRYETPLPALVERVDEKAGMVASHLARMGVR